MSGGVRYLPALLAGLRTAISLYGQSPAPAAPRAVRQCGTLEFKERECLMIQRNMLLRLWAARATRAATAAAATEGAVTGAIPIAFHVIHDGAEGKLPAEQIAQQIEVLNRAFAPARFELARLDYSDNPAWFRMFIFSRAEFEAKGQLSIDPASHLNIYTCKPPEWLLGWGWLPFLAAYFPTLDGVTVDYTSLPGGAGFPYDEGDNMVHEVGHWAGLFHTFQGRCYGPFNDMVDDTPAEASPGYGCEPGRDTCPSPGLDPIDNFMDYSDDACAERFTPGQVERMTMMLQAYRPQIWMNLLLGNR